MMIPERRRGFEIFHDSAKNIVTLRLNGFWDAQLGERFEREFQERVQKVHAHGKDWHLLLDLTRYPSQPQEIQNIVSRAILFAKKKGMRNKAILADRSIGLFQTTNRIQDPELQVHFYFQSEDDAIRWLLD